MTEWRQIPDESAELGTLGSVNSAEEQAAVQKLGTTEELWIGFNDRASAGSFVWVDGSAP
jgi:hypothetical protein